MKSFKGKVLFLDRSDINTDEIIPAKYLTEVSKQALKPHLLEDLQIDGFIPSRDIKDKKIIISRDNFGCGSSREHAPWALEVNDINLVIASGFARIFRQNMYNCGMAAVELKADEIDALFSKFSGKDCEAELDVKSETIIVSGSGITEKFNLSMGGFDKTLIKSGGWLDYADANY